MSQTFPETDLRLALSLGRGEAGRRDEQFLFIALNRGPLLEPWLAALRRHQARLVSLHTPVLLCPALLPQSLSCNASNGVEPWLLFLVGRAGVRQIAWVNGQIRFARLSQPEAGESLESLCLRLALRGYQYLLGQRLLERPQHLRCRIWAPEVDLAALKAGSAGNELEWESWSNPGGGPAGLAYRDADAAMLQTLARRPPPLQLAPPSERWQDRMCRAAAALQLAAALVLVLALVAGLWLWDQSARTQQSGERTRAQSAQLTSQLAALEAELPPLPMAAPALHELVQQQRQWQAYRPSPEGLWQIVSEALESAPDLDVDKLEWQLATGERREALPQASATSRLPIFTSAVIHGHLSQAYLQANAGDGANHGVMVQGFADALARRPGLRVQVLRLPSDMEGRRIADDTQVRFTPARFIVQVSQGVVP